MKMNSLMVGRYTLFFWGVMDFSYLIYYSAKSLLNQRIPYWTDLVSTLVLIGDHGSMAAIVVISSWILQLSILASCAALLLSSKMSIYIVYIQTPFRMLLFVPSFFVLALLPSETYEIKILFIALMIALEIIKVWSIKKHI